MNRPRLEPALDRAQTRAEQIANRDESTRVKGVNKERQRFNNSIIAIRYHLSVAVHEGSLEPGKEFGIIRRAASLIQEFRETSEKVLDESEQHKSRQRIQRMKKINNDLERAGSFLERWIVIKKPGELTRWWNSAGHGKEATFHRKFKKYVNGAMHSFIQRNDNALLTRSEYAEASLAKIQYYDFFRRHNPIELPLVQSLQKGDHSGADKTRKIQMPNDRRPETTSPGESMPKSIDGRDVLPNTAIGRRGAQLEGDAQYAEHLQLEEDAKSIQLEGDAQYAEHLQLEEDAKSIQLEGDAQYAEHLQLEEDAKSIQLEEDAKYAQRIADSQGESSSSKGADRQSDNETTLSQNIGKIHDPKAAITVELQIAQTYHDLLDEFQREALDTETLQRYKEIVNRSAGEKSTESENDLTYLRKINQDMREMVLIEMSGAKSGDVRLNPFISALGIVIEETRAAAKWARGIEEFNVKDSWVDPQRLKIGKNAIEEICKTYRDNAYARKVIYSSNTAKEAALSYSPKDAIETYSELMQANAPLKDLFSQLKGGIPGRFKPFFIMSGQHIIPRELDDLEAKLQALIRLGQPDWSEDEVKAQVGFIQTSALKREELLNLSDEKTQIFWGAARGGIV